MIFEMLREKKVGAIILKKKVKSEKLLWDIIIDNFGVYNSTPF